METKLTVHQKEIFDAITTDIKQNIFSRIKGDNIGDYMLSLTGPVGTGKSFLTAKIVDEINRFIKERSYSNNDNIRITAPTHKAVRIIKDMLSKQGVNAECMTIHSFLNMKPFYDYITGSEKFIIDRFKNTHSRSSLLIVDESSMISTELYKFISEAVTKGCVNTVLFIGDPYQLLPIDQEISDVFS